MPEEPVLVDTDVASALYLERYYDRRVSASLAGTLATRRLAISLITLGEAHYGARKRKMGTAADHEHAGLLPGDV